MNKIQKITVIAVVAAIAIVLTPIMSGNIASGNSSIHLAIKEIKSVPQGEKIVLLTDQQLSGLPSVSKGLVEADKIFASVNMNCQSNCTVNYRQESPDSYTTAMLPDEASLTLSSLGFHDILRPGDTKPLYHGTTVEYNGKYYAILIMGI